MSLSKKAKLGIIISTSIVGGFLLIGSGIGIGYAIHRDFYSPSFLLKTSMRCDVTLVNCTEDNEQMTGVYDMYWTRDISPYSLEGQVVIFSFASSIHIPADTILMFDLQNFGSGFEYLKKSDFTPVSDDNYVDYGVVHPQSVNVFFDDEIIEWKDPINFIGITRIKLSFHFSAEYPVNQIGIYYPTLYYDTLPT